MGWGGEEGDREGGGNRLLVSLSPQPRTMGTGQLSDEPHPVATIIMKLTIFKQEHFYSDSAMKNQTTRLLSSKFAFQLNSRVSLFLQISNTISILE